MKLKILTLCLSLSLSLNLYSQKDTVTVKEIEISTDRVPMLYSQTSRVVEVITKEQISQMPSQTIDDVLRYALNVDVRQRGSFNVQSDISIRGGSNEETLILLNGVKINDPQTGHYNINIPVDINDIERIEILEGPGSRIFGPDAFSGAINIITVSHENDNVRLSLAGGDHQYYDAAASVTFNSGRMNNNISIDQNASNGYIPDSDFKINNFMYQGNYKGKGINMNIIAAYLDKSMGANNFYSVSFPNEYEHTKTSLLNFKADFGNTIHWTTNIYWRTNQDKFVLKRDNPPFYTNYHLTSVLGGEVNGYYLSKLGKTSIGAEYRRESILSNRLGNPLSDTIQYHSLSWGYYDHGKARDNVNLFADHVYSVGGFTCSLGLLVNWTSDYNWHVYPGLDVSYKLSERFKVFASANKSLRLPTFTDLYYTDPSHLGNPNLKPEEAVTYETGIKYNNSFINAHVSVFRRYATNIIDWIWVGNKTQSNNLTKLTTDGIEFSTDLLTNKLIGSACPIKYLNISYTYINTIRSSDDYLSYYTLDYLRNKFAVSLHHKIYKNLTASWAYSYNSRAGTYKDETFTDRTFKPYSLLDGKINYKFQASGSRFHISNLYIEASNIFNKPFTDIGNVQMPGRWVKAGIELRIEN